MTTKLIVAISVFNLFTSFATAKPNYSQADNMKACGTIEAGNEEAAISACQELVDSRKVRGRQLAITYNNIGVALSRMSNYERAVEAYSSALNVDARYVLARVNRARGLGNIARYSDAITDMDAAIKLEPSAINYAIRADFRSRNNDFSAAITDYSEAIKRQPMVGEHYLERGRIYDQLSMHTEAIEDYSRAIQINPRDPALYYGRGIAWMNAGKCDQAIPDYTKAIELSPRFSTAYNNRGICYNRGGRRSEAIADFEAALKWSPGNDKARRNLESATSTAVARPVPPVIEVPRFELPPVQELLRIPEYPIDVLPSVAEPKD